MELNKLLIKSILLCGSFFITGYSYCQIIESTSTNNQVLKSDFSKFPDVSSKIFYDFQKIAKDTQRLSTIVHINENGKECALKSMQAISLNDNVNIHIVPDYSVLTKKTLDKSLKLISQLSSTWLAKIHYYVYDSNNLGITYKLPTDSLQLKFANYILNSEILINLYDTFIQMNNESFNLILLLTEDLTNSYLELISESQKQLPKSNNYWFGILYNGKNRTELADYPTNNNQIINNRESILHIKTSSKKDERKLANQIYNFINSFYLIDFTANTIKDLCYEYNYQIMISGDTLNYQVIFEEQFIKNKFEESTLYYLEGLISSSEFLEANNYLAQQLNIYSSNELRLSAKELIISYYEQLLESENIDTALIFNFAENDYGFKTETDLWYRELKIKLLHKKLNSIVATDDNILERYNITRYLKQLDKNSEEINLLFLESKGDFESINSNNWEALTLYHEYLESSENNEVRTKLLKLLNIQFEESHKNRDYSDIYRIGRDFKSYFSNNFPLRFIYGLSCSINNDFINAIKEYKWLIDNWNENQKLVGWEKLFYSLKDLYVNTLQFEEAIALNQRMFRQNGDEQELFDLIKNTRAKYLYTFAEIINRCVKNVGTNSNIAKINDHILIKYPEFIEGVYLINSQSNLSLSIYARNSINIPKSRYTSGISLYSDIGLKKAWIILPTTLSRLLVIEYDLALNADEQIQITNIKNNKHQSSTWNELFNYEKEIGYALIAQIIAGVTQTELSCINKSKISQYWYIIKSHHFIKYLVLHGENGIIKESFLFNKELAVYESNMWEKSSFAKAFFTQEITYNKKSTIDIVNPVYLNNKWINAIRIGFE